MKKEEEEFLELEEPELSGTKDFPISIKRRRKRHSAGSSGAAITLSGSITSDSALNGAAIGTLAVDGGVGVYTFSFFLNPGNLFSIVGSSLQVAAAPLTPGLDVIVVKADNGAGSVLFGAFIITVNHVVAGYVPTYELLGF